MAGANNAQMKAQGFSQRQIEKKRASVKGPLTLDAMRRNPAAGWQAAARGEGGEARRAAVAQRDAFVKASQARAKRSALAQQGARDLGSTMMASRKAKAAQEAAGKARRGELTGRGLRDVSAAMMAKRKAAAKPSLSSAMDRFRNQAHRTIDSYYQRQGYSAQRPRLEFQEGEKYIRVVRNDGTSKSAHSFIDKATGDIFKADGWKRPAKGARGNVFRGDFGLTDSGSVQYSARYERRRGG